MDRFHIDRKIELDDIISSVLDDDDSSDDGKVKIDSHEIIAMYQN